MASSIVSIVLGHATIVGAFAAQLLANIVLVVTTYGVARRLAGKAAGFVAAIVAAAAPVTIDYSHSYSFALPAAALFTTALWAHLRSGRLTAIGWSALWGTALGGMVIARTMTIAFLPGFLAVAVLHIVVSERKRRSLAGLGVGLLTGSVVAGPWYWAQGASVWHYLTDAGYGADSAQYGAARSLFSWASWQQFFHDNTDKYLGLPLAVLLLGGGIALTVVVIRRFRSDEASWRWILRSPWVVPVAVIAEGLVALMSSRNEGSGFLAPLVPAMCAVAICALFQVAADRAWRIAVIVVAVVFVAMPTYAMKSVVGGLVDQRLTWAVTVPGWGTTNVEDSSSPYQRHMADEYRPDDPNGAQWQPVNADVGAIVWDLTGGETRLPALVTFGFNHRIVNPNTLELSWQMARGVQFPVALMTPTIPLDDVDGYSAELKGFDVFGRQILLLSCDPVGVYPPSLSCDAERRAAQGLGFHQYATVPLPDTATLQVWVQGFPGVG